MTKEEAAQFIQTCKERFPNPKQGNLPGVCPINDYCIGGAACRVATEMGKLRYDYAHNFPVIETVVQMLIALNERLKKEEIKTRIFASEIILMNDSGLFDEAWDGLHAMLRYGESEGNTDGENSG